ncbi:MAG TPA: hypothetical protein VKD90_24930 [Gemmataceae bacterium]|nr:hypothetical protein [Gemmataceae bacterium]
MRITYFTLDDVNQDLVRRWAARAGARVTCSAGGPPAGGPDRPAAVIVDLDFLPPEVRVGWVRKAVAGEVPCPVFAHGHNIADADAVALSRHGVRVCRGRLRRAVLIGWLRRVAQVPAVSGS